MRKIVPLSQCYALLPFELLRKNDEIKMISPFYHTVSDEKLIYCNHVIYTKTVNQFMDDLDFLLKHYNPLSLETLLKIVENNEEIQKPSFFLSFDDGLKEIKDVIAPILFQKGVPATFFINSDFLDNQELFYRFKINLLIEKYLTENWTNIEEKRVKTILQNENRRYKTLFDLLDLHFNNIALLDELAEILAVDFSQFLLDKKPYLTAQQVENLLKDGFSIGAHSKDHPLYFTISEEEQFRQTTESVERICTRFQLPYRVFAFPFTDTYLSNSFFEKISPFVDVTFGTSGIKYDSIRTNFQRISLERRAESAKITLKREYFLNRIRKIAGRGEIVRK